MSNVKERDKLEKIQEEIQEELLGQIDRGVSLSDEELRENIEKGVLNYGQNIYLSIEEKITLVKRIFNSIRRLDVLQELLEDPEITEIMVNGPDHIFVEKEGSIRDSGKYFASVRKLEDVIQQIVSKVNRVVNEASPIVDVRLLDGSRVNVVLPPVALDGPVLTIRRFPETPFSMEKLLEIGSISEEAVLFLKTLVEARYNIFISGGTGSGKTTFLNALSNFIPSGERIITIEDSAELQIQNVPNLVRMETRNANLEGKNAITIRDLVRAALRQRPDRIIIGEIRDAAVIELLSAMNTGHDGSISTGHANSPADMLRRLETLVLTGMDIPLPAVRSQIASGIEIVVQLGRLRDKTRKVLEIDEVEGIEEGEIVLRPLYRFQETEGSDADHVRGELVSTGKRLSHRRKLEMAGKELAFEKT
jgi:pilus assembly protein CpaF